MIKKIIKFFDKLENEIRGKLSHYPILYAFLGGVGVVLFWRGVWHTADSINIGSILSIIIGSVILLLIGAFVSTFIGSRLIISGLIGEKKLVEKAEGEIEKAESEIETEEIKIRNLQSTLNRVEKKLDHLEEDIH